jgi:hypothetical protein
MEGNEDATESDEVIHRVENWEILDANNQLRISNKKKDKN